MFSFRSFYVTAAFLCVLVFNSNLSIAQVDFTTTTIDPGATYLLKMEDGKRYAGRIERVGSDFLLMTRRSGRQAWPDLADIKSLKKVDDKFVPKTVEQIREGLVKEFQGKYVVSKTGHFLVVHPPGSYEKWAFPFEKFYANFRAYWRARGVQLKEPEFPLVAVVLRTQREFQRIAKSKNLESAGGYFSHDSNRMFTYVRDFDSVGKAQNHQYTLYVVYHEIAHQLAFNTGLQERGTSSAQWFSEGLAQLFEAKGVNDSIKHSTLKSRVHYSELKRYLDFRESGKAKSIVDRLMTGRELFNANEGLAYSSAWALMMYLAETRPQDLAKYVRLQRDKARRGSNRWSRKALFEKSFGETATVEAHMNQYMNRLAEEVGLK